MKRYIYILLLIFSIGLPELKAKSTDPNDVIIEGRIDDATTKLKPNQKFTVEISVSAFPGNLSWAPFKKYIVEADRNNQFKLTIPSPASLFYLHMTFSQGPGTFIDKIFLLEKGDRISMEIKGSDIAFSGKGSIKLSCQNEIFKIKPSIKRMQQFYIQDKKKDFELESHYLDSLLDLRLAIAERFKPLLQKEIYEIIKINCYGLRYFTWLRGNFGLRKQPEKFKDFVSSKAFSEINRSMEKLSDANLLIAAPIYIDFICLLTQFEYQKETGNRDHSSLEARRWMFNRIVTKYSGVVREKLLTTFFLNLKKDADAVSFVDSALNIVKKADYRAIIEEIKGQMETGRPFYAFELENDKGEMVKLSDFNNKVVFIDFWFTGCGPCKALNANMKPVLAHFKDNPNVKFVSISVDADKNFWLKSVATGDYTHPESINLHAGGKGASTEKEHPLVKAYGINSFPKLFLLKNGRVYHSDPPRPATSDNGDPKKGNTKKMIDLINEAVSGL